LNCRSYEYSVHSRNYLTEGEINAVQCRNVIYFFEQIDVPIYKEVSPEYLHKSGHELGFCHASANADGKSGTDPFISSIDRATLEFHTTYFSARRQTGWNGSPGGFYFDLLGRAGFSGAKRGGTGRFPTQACFDAVQRE
jgi:hypothetical protein